MSNDRRKSIRTLSGLRKEIGSAIWLFVAYADMAGKGWSASDDDLACALGTSTVTILRWKIRLIERVSFSALTKEAAKIDNVASAAFPLLLKPRKTPRQ